MNVGIYSRSIETRPLPALQLLFDLLNQYKVSVFLYEDDIAFVHKKFSLRVAGTFSSYENVPKDLDIMISLGGDGTFLEAAGIIRDKEIPIIGINFGRLGFLADANKQNIENIIKAILHNNYFIDTRTLLHVDYCNSKEVLFDKQPFALNDCVIKSLGVGSMLQIKVFLNGEFLTSYWADGVIVATPTGSTGYSLSCHGPIVFPDTSCFILTPIAAHNLNVRTIIIPDTAIITFEVLSRDNKFICSLDTRHYILNTEISIGVKKESFSTHIIKLHEKSFLDTIKHKLLWGEDPRNLKA